MPLNICKPNTHMTLFKHISYIAAAFMVMTVASAQAQYRLPDSHKKQHNHLLTSQKPLAADIKVANTLKYLSELNRVEKPDEAEVFGDYWESAGVNPYANAVIPEVKDIDVSSYFHPVPGYVTSNFGYRPRFGRIHKGIDLKLQVGDTVRAAFDGKVRLTKFERRGYGYYVVIRHDNGMETVYGHLSKFLVSPDQRVKAGQPIALGGNTGRSTGAHLHFETRYMGIAINPAEIIDFENKVAIKDVFTFEKAIYEKAQKYTPKKRKAVRRTTASSASKKRKATKTAKKK